MEKKTIFFILSLALVLILSSATFAISEKILDTNNEQICINSDSYTGRLRVYVVEIESRWDDHAGNPYHYGFLGFAINEKLDIDYEGSYTNQVTWDAQSVEEDNIMVIAAVFNPKSNQEYSYPPNINLFLAHYVDAAAAAKPGETGYNTVTDGFTHTVFIEEGTVQWCPSCPAASEALNRTYNKHEYPFYFAAMVTEKDTDADNRLKVEYNLYGYPTLFFDGGYEVIIGGVDEDADIEAMIEQCGGRDVHELDLSVSLECNDGKLEISVSITNNEKTTASQSPISKLRLLDSFISRLRHLPLFKKLLFF